MDIGDEVRCKITGFVGTITAHCQYLNGCVTMQVTAAKLQKGRPVKEWIDDAQLELAPKKKRVRKPVRKEVEPVIPRYGGPHDTPERDVPPEEDQGMIVGEYVVVAGTQPLNIDKSTGIFRSTATLEDVVEWAKSVTHANDWELSLTMQITLSLACPNYPGSPDIDVGER